jgi:hypothetical protein
MRTGKVLGLGWGSTMKPFIASEKGKGLQTEETKINTGRIHTDWKKVIGRTSSSDRRNDRREKDVDEKPPALFSIHRGKVGIQKLLHNWNQLSR